MTMSSTAAVTSAIAVIVSFAGIAGTAFGTFTAAVSATAMVASPVPPGLSVARFCDSERTLKMGQDGVSDMETDDHRTKHGDHGSRDQQSLPSARQSSYITLALTSPRH